MEERRRPVTYRGMAEGEEGEISSLIRRVFSTHIAHTYTPDGREEFMRIIEPETLVERKRGGQLIILAVSDGEIVGVIAVRNTNHITLLFVDDRRHRMGIGKGLVRKAFERARVLVPGLEEFTVNSSPYAVKFYERIGFQPTGPERMKDGMRITPMRIRL